MCATETKHPYSLVVLPFSTVQLRAHFLLNLFFVSVEAFGNTNDLHCPVPHKGELQVLLHDILVELNLRASY